MSLKAALAACAVALATCGLPATATAQERIALVIGNGAYQAMPKMRTPANDARALAELFRKLGFDVTEVTDLDRSRMEGALSDFVRNATSAKMVVLFYAGQGMQVDGRQYMFAVDAKVTKVEELKSTAFALDDVLAKVLDRSRTTIAFVHASRDNPLARSPSRPLGGEPRPPWDGWFVVSNATAPSNVVSEGGGEHSPYAAALLKHLATPGIDISVVLRRVRGDVVQATRQKQIPWDDSQLAGEVILAPELKPQ